MAERDTQDIVKTIQGFPTEFSLTLFLGHAIQDVQKDGDIVKEESIIALKSPKELDGDPQKRRQKSISIKNTTVNIENNTNLAKIQNLPQKRQK
ncbi:hypothetical protein M8J77_017110 [Diaphorina citri]|nr:hypothetical protein M8J77_017110 [Diaphorina citri]